MSSAKIILFIWNQNFLNPYHHLIGQFPFHTCNISFHMANVSHAANDCGHSILRRLFSISRSPFLAVKSLVLRQLTPYDDDMASLSPPPPYSPERHGHRGRLPSRYQVDDPDAAPIEVRHLILSRTVDGRDLKYSLSNLTVGGQPLSWCELLERHMQRYWVEQSFEDAKSEVRMDEYQVRTWCVWHHHMALTMHALLFMLQQRAPSAGDAVPFLERCALILRSPQKSKWKHEPSRSIRSQKPIL